MGAQPRRRRSSQLFRGTDGDLRLGWLFVFGLGGGFGRVTGRRRHGGVGIFPRRVVGHGRCDGGDRFGRAHAPASLPPLETFAGGGLGLFERLLVHALAPRPPSLPAVLQPVQWMGQPVGGLRERETGDQIHGDDQQRGGDHHGAGDIERIHQVRRDRKAQSAADADHAAEQAEGQERQARTGAEGEHGRADQFDGGRLHVIGTDPLPGQQKGHQGEQKGRRAEDLEQQVGEVSSGIADQIEGVDFGGGVPRRDPGRGTRSDSAESPVPAKGAGSQ